MTREIFNKELREVKDKLFQVTGDVRRNLKLSVRYLEKRDMTGAKMIVESDEIINLKVLEIEDLCLSIIATQQPVASDLRLLFSILQISTEIERIGDYAKGIARISLKIGSESLIKPLIDIPGMEQLAGQMLSDAITAFIEDNAVAAESISRRDARIDAMYNQVHRELLTFVMEKRSNINQTIMLDWIAHNLERVGDRVTNICERIIFTVTGNSVDLN
ncbi:MAG: phosphate transport system regulatory protein PhoU [Gemmatimonadaceae bacterium 4484_173]|nr:MAG: phosphate transport system regulatory protein PhoU [Gemmatimonadaceae bacterium 4484_173]RKZ05143.1 MAG: phosphate transport system regulatory protein PhoU [Candidatus Fermentibacteria bacterium]